ncbi:hypothetical protein [Subtercola frigoramans]|uniref:Uncharacterized membrane protein (DUF485 family) n=1 Tax=Subtercola frigoramans TaxID=120298 RepID=A0ABS2L1I4_9MICO|nr:hypothetical protein [Subtercola frigoramans]MBM7470922.1 uncharacterized membrane protein (DUF485 family) [Subtercola frigoramans]
MNGAGKPFFVVSLYAAGVFILSVVYIVIANLLGNPPIGHSPVSLVVSIAFIAGFVVGVMSATLGVITMLFERKANRFDGF